MCEKERSRIRKQKPRHALVMLSCVERAAADMRSSADEQSSAVASGRSLQGDGQPVAMIGGAAYWSGVLAASVEQVADLGPVGAGNERLLHRRLRDALRRTGAARVLETEGRLRRHDTWWTRAPGGIDVVATRQSDDQEYALAVECKIGKLDELLWDAIKLGPRCGDKPWNFGLETAALVVELEPLHDPRAVSWFDLAVTKVAVVKAIAEWPEAWYGLMCGGRGIRPTSLPSTLILGAGGTVPHAVGRSALCWRLVTAGPVGDHARVAVDTHGWPPQVAISDEWRRQIDLAAASSTRPPRVTLPDRRVRERPPGATVADLVIDADGRLWADAWDSREMVPTSFRLAEGDPTRYDVMRAKNNALRFADPPRHLPAWCASAVVEAFARM